MVIASTVATESCCSATRQPTRTPRLFSFKPFCCVNTSLLFNQSNHNKREELDLRTSLALFDTTALLFVYLFCSFFFHLWVFLNCKYCLY